MKHFQRVQILTTSNKWLILCVYVLKILSLENKLGLKDCLKGDIPRIDNLTNTLLDEEYLENNLTLKRSLSSELEIIVAVRKAGRESGEWLKEFLQTCPHVSIIQSVKYEKLDVILKKGATA